MRAILGIHSSVTKTGSSSNPVSYISSSDGHAWISLRVMGVTETYSLYPDNNPRIRQSGRDVSRKTTDIRKNFEIDERRRALENRYYGLDSLQLMKLKALLRLNVRHRVTENCASWAAETVREVTGRNIKADERILRFIESPRRLSRHIVKLEHIRKTSITDPIPPLPEPKEKE